MKKSRILAFLLALVMLIGMAAGCAVPVDSGATPGPETTQTGGTPTEAPESPAPSQLGVKNAKKFSIDYLEDGVKLVKDAEGRKLLLVPSGATVPAGYEDAAVISTPITRAMYASTTQVGYLGALEIDALYDSIVAVTTAPSDWTTPQVIERFESGQITYIVQDMWNAGDIEEVIGVAPEIVFSSGASESGVKLQAMLDEAQIDYAVVIDWLEENAAASLEWIKFFAAFYNLDEEADKVYEAKLARLDELYAMTAGISEADRPVVAFGLVYDGIVYTQAGSSTLAQEIEKAGGTYALKDLEGEGSVQLGMEEFFDKCKDADVLIYSSLPQYLADKAALLDTEPLFAEFKAFRNDKIYILDQGYYMNSAKVVEKFEDIVFMFHPNLLPGHQLVMYSKLADKAQ